MMAHVPSVLGSRGHCFGYFGAPGIQLPGCLAQRNLSGPRNESLTYELMSIFLVQPRDMDHRRRVVGEFLIATGPI